MEKSDLLVKYVSKKGKRDRYFMLHCMSGEKGLQMYHRKSNDVLCISVKKGHEKYQPIINGKGDLWLHVSGPGRTGI